MNAPGQEHTEVWGTSIRPAEHGGRETGVNGAVHLVNGLNAACQYHLEIEVERAATQENSLD